MSMTKFGISRDEYEISGISTTNKTLNRNYLKLASMVEENKGKVEVNDRKISKLVRKNGTSTMTGNLKMGDNKIVDLADSADLKDAVNRQQLLAVGAESIQSAVTEAEKTCLKLDGTNSMEEDLDMDSNKVTNLGAPSALTNAANKQYVDQKFFLYNKPTILK